MVAPTFPLTAGSINGGTQGVAYYLCSALRDTGAIDLDILRPNATPTLPGRLLMDGHVVFPLSRPRWQPRAMYILWGLRHQVLRAISQLKPDVIHIQGLAGLAARAGHKAVLTVHGISERDVLFSGSPLTTLLRSQVLRMTEGRPRRRVKHIIAISPYTREFLAGDGSQRVWDVANPVAQSFFDIDRRPSPARVFSASHFTKLKNVGALIRAFAPLAQVLPNAELRLAGSHQDSAYSNECRQLAARLGIAEQVKFLGLLTIQQVQEELATASLFALCSLQENAPLSISEAMAAGVPVIASKVGGIPCMVDDGLTGHLVDPANQNDITAKMEKMLLSGDLSVMGRAARAKAERNYHPQVTAERTLAVYREILRSAPQESHFQ